MSAWPVSPGPGRIAKARRAPSGLIAGSVSLRGPEVIATKRTDDGDGRSARAGTRAHRPRRRATAARAIDAATDRFALSRRRRRVVVGAAGSCAGDRFVAVAGPEHQSISALADRLDVRGLRRVVAERPSQLPNRAMQHVVETKTPGQTRATSCLARHHFAGSFGERFEHLHHLRLEAHFFAAARQPIERRMHAATRRPQTASPPPSIGMLIRAGPAISIRDWGQTDDVVIRSSRSGLTPISRTIIIAADRN